MGFRVTNPNPLPLLNRSVCSVRKGKVPPLMAQYLAVLGVTGGPVRPAGVDGRFSTCAREIDRERERERERERDNAWHFGRTVAGRGNLGGRWQKSEAVIERRGEGNSPQD